MLLAAGLLLVGCDPERTRLETPRTEALAAAVWEQSEWISVKDAPVADANARREQRAADGTSCFRRQVVNAKAVKSAKWMTTGLGVYELYLNGMPVGADVLKPGFTHARKTKCAFTYDVTALLRTGAGEKNDFGAEVSAGWWRDKIVSYAGTKSAFRCVIELTYADGTKELVGTRAAEWYGKVAGPVLHAAIFDGEEFDARETNEARKPSAEFAAGGCEVNDEFKGEIVPTVGAEVCARCDLAIRKGSCTVKPGETVIIDFGQNCAAVPFFRFRAARGTVLTVLPGEMLNDADKGQRGCDGPKGSLYRENLRIPKSGMRVVYTFAGEDVEQYVPHFTFFGYRYIALTATDVVKIDEIASVPVTSIKKEMELGRIETGVPELNRLIANVYWGQLSNYLSVPTDCPQRNERLGWTADTQVFCEAGTFNANTLAFFRKWMRDMRDSQHEKGGFPGVAPAAQYGNEAMRVGWADAGIIVPYQIWKQFGDKSIVDENWEAMDKFMRHVDANKYDHIALKAENGNYQWADWLSFEPLESCSGRGWVTPDGQRLLGLRPETVEYWNYLSACYWMLDAQMMAKMASGTGRDPKPYEEMAARAKKYLQETFLVEGGAHFKTTLFDNMQTPFLFVLKLGLNDGSAKDYSKYLLRENFAQHMNRLQTGFLGTSIIMDALTENGMADIAYDLLLQRENPSWLYSVDQGATTIWERWNSYTKKDGFGPVGMNSFNHYAYGSVLAWIYKTAAGIAADPAQPGFKNIIMKPVPDRRLGYVTASYDSAAGLIKSAWRYEGEKWIWEFTVPEGATASVTLPNETVVRKHGAGTYRYELVLK